MISHANTLRDVAPFPHDASIHHLPRLQQRAIPAGGKVSFQSTPSAQHASMVRRAQRAAERKGVDVLERRGFEFFGTHPDLHLALQAANITRHYYAEHDIIYVIKSGNGHIVAQGNAEIPNALNCPLRHQGVLGHAGRQEDQGLQCSAFSGRPRLPRPFWKPLYRFLNSADQHLAATSPQDLVDAFVAIAWMEDEWME